MRKTRLRSESWKISGCWWVTVGPSNGETQEEDLWLSDDYITVWQGSIGGLGKEVGTMFTHVCQAIGTSSWRSKHLVIPAASSGYLRRMRGQSCSSLLDISVTITALGVDNLAIRSISKSFCAIACSIYDYLVRKRIRLLSMLHALENSFSVPCLVQIGLQRPLQTVVGPPCGCDLTRVSWSALGRWACDLSPVWHRDSEI